MKKVVTFGEIMMRLNPPGYLRLKQAHELEVTFAGGESNVAVSVANYGLHSTYVTKLPEGDIGQCAVNELRKYGVDTSQIVRGGPRLGLFFMEKGASQRPSVVIYDRAGSSIALAKPGDFDWAAIFQGADWFHFTGITPALGGDLPAICLEACKKARELGLTISCDINYRKKLWTKQEARAVMEQLMPYVDVCISNEEDATDVFGIQAQSSDVAKGVLNQEDYISMARQLVDRFAFKQVAFTLRRSISASENDWGGMLYQDGQAYFAPTYHIKLVDRVGGGDSFGGGLIYALLAGYGPQEAIQFAVAASCLKQTMEHDLNMATVAEVEALAKGNASGRVQR